MKVLMLSNYPSPYRVKFFELLGKKVELTVLFEERPDQQKHRNAEWFIDTYNNFNAVFLNEKKLFGFKKTYSPEVISWLQKPYDIVVLLGYATVTAIISILYMKRKARPFYLEVDGGIIKKEHKIKKYIKQSLVSAAAGWFSTGKEVDSYLIYYGAKKEKIYRYPFSSVDKDDILPRVIPSYKKSDIKKMLNIHEPKMVLAVGQFIYRKGFDTLIKAAHHLPNTVGVYFVGGIPTNEYIELQNASGSENVHFLGFKRPEELKRYYMASDVFVLPTREDIWGLVVNEAMANGVPVVTTNKCIAGLELIDAGKNGYIIAPDNEKLLCRFIEKVLVENEDSDMSRCCLDRIKDCTIQNMAEKHFWIFNSILS